MRRLYVLLAGLMMILAGSRSIHAASTKTSPVTLRSIRMVSTRFGWGISRTHILRTSDGGRLWRDVTPPAYKPRNLGSLEGWTMLDARHAWIVGADPRPQHTEMGSAIVFRTSDGGQHWQQSRRMAGYAGARPDTLKFSDAKHGWLLLATSASMSQAGWDVYQTDDGGATWMRVMHKGYQQSAPHALPGCDCQLNLTFFDAAHGFATGYWGVAQNYSILSRSFDGGHSWYPMQLPLPPGFRIPFYATSPPTLSITGHGLMLAHMVQPQAFVLYRTVNGGATWQPGAALPGPAQVFFIAPGSFSIPDTQHAFVLVRSVLYRTDNAGLRWYVVNHHLPLPVGLTHIQFLNAFTGFAIPVDESPEVDRSFLLTTHDGGRSWRRVSMMEQR